MLRVSNLGPPFRYTSTAETHIIVFSGQEGAVCRLFVPPEDKKEMYSQGILQRVRRSNCSTIRGSEIRPTGARVPLMRIIGRGGWCSSIIFTI